MSTYETLLLEIDDRGLAYVSRNRPDKQNALSVQMISELTQSAETVGANASTRAMVFTGTGDVCCEGGDLGWMMEEVTAE